MKEYSYRIAVSCCSTTYLTEGDWSGNINVSGNLHVATVENSWNEKYFIYSMQKVKIVR
jgi:hypothetical protein